MAAYKCKVVGPSEEGETQEVKTPVPANPAETKKQFYRVHSYVGFIKPIKEVV